MNTKTLASEKKRKKNQKLCIRWYIQHTNKVYMIYIINILYPYSVATNALFIQRALVLVNIIYMFIYRKYNKKEYTIYLGTKSLLNSILFFFHIILVLFCIFFLLYFFKQHQFTFVKMPIFVCIWWGNLKKMENAFTMCDTFQRKIKDGNFYVTGRWMILCWINIINLNSKYCVFNQVGQIFVMELNLDRVSFVLIYHEHTITLCNVKHNNYYYNMWISSRITFFNVINITFVK